MSHNKEELIATIRNAKAAHKRWVENALSLIEGLPLDKSQVPVNATDCIFGQWYYSEGQSFKALPHFRHIEKHHDALHYTYREIFLLLFGEDNVKPSLLSRLFGTAQKSNKEKLLTAREKYIVLQEQSKTIIRELDGLEDIILKLTPEEIASYIAHH